MYRPLVSAVLTAVLLSGSAIAWAGNNAGGTARLSWNPTVLVRSMDRAPGAAFPLYVQLDGASDVRSLSLWLQWTPEDSVTGCYRVVSGLASATCGTGVEAPPNGAFDGDSAYAWTISFPPGSDRRCVTYQVTGGMCQDSVPATFHLIAARSIDSNGEIDELVIGAPITLAGGVEGTLPLSVTSLGSRQLLPGRTNLLPIKGTGFNSWTSVELRSGGQTLFPTSLDLCSPELLIAQFQVPNVEGTTWTLFADDPFSAEAPAPVMVSVADTTMLTGSGVNGFDWPIDKIGPVGVFRKEPGTSVWTSPPLDTITNAQESASQVANRQQPLLSRRPVPHRVQGPCDGPTGCLSEEVVFSDGFEFGSFDPVWEHAYIQGQSHYDWGVWNRLYDCSFQSLSGGGDHAAHCSAANDTGTAICHYDDRTYNYLRIRSADRIDLGNYQSYTASFWTLYSTNPTPADGDFFYWSYAVNSGSFNFVTRFSGNSFGWQQKKITIANQFSDSNYFRINFGFTTSEETGASGFGVYVDNVVVAGTPRDLNLAYVQPSGWSGPITASWRRGTVVTDTLFTGQATYVDWAVINAGLGNITCPFRVRLLFDNATVKDTCFSTGLSQDQIAILFDTPVTVPTGQAGSHTLRLEIDYDHRIDEQFEGDNAYELTRTWYNPPDLIVTGITSTPNPADVNTYTSIAVTIRNQGTFAAAGPFHVGVYFTGPAVASGQFAVARTTALADTVFVSSTLLPGTSRTFTLMRSSSTIGSWNCFAIVDPGNVVPEGTSEGNNQSSTLSISWVQPRVFVMGTIKTLDSTATPGVYDLVPLAGVKVVLFDADGADTTGADQLGVGWTDQSGRFGPIAAENFDPDDSNHQLDVFVRVVLESGGGCAGATSFVVRDRELRTWTLPPTTITYNVPNSYQLDLGDILPDTTDYDFRAAAHIYVAIRSAQDWVSQRGNCMTRVDVYWEPENDAETHYDASLASIFINDEREPARLTPDAYDDGIVIHEYGHHVQKVFGFWSPIGQDEDPDHTWYQQSATEERAFVEGWAGYFAATVLGTTGYPDVGLNAAGTAGSYQEVEFEGGGVRFDPQGTWEKHGTRGKFWSMACAAALWDFQDSQNDQDSTACGDQFNGGIQAMWQTVRDGLTYGPGLCWFYLDFKQVVNPPPGSPTVEAQLDEILCAHGAFPCYGPNTSVMMSNTVASEPIVVWPSPATGSVSISFGSNRIPEPVTIRVFDVAGHRVRVVWDGLVPAESRSITWDGRDSRGAFVPAGAYFIQVRRGARTDVRRLAIIR